MQQDKLHEIITKKNNQLEQEALNEASSIIEQISMKQESINRTQKDIEKLREQLKSLEIEQLDSKVILGE